MDAHEALRRLAEAAGIEARYWDIHGQLHEAAPDEPAGARVNFGWDGFADDLVLGPAEQFGGGRIPQLNDQIEAGNDSGKR